MLANYSRTIWWQITFDFVVALVLFFVLIFLFGKTISIETVKKYLLGFSGLLGLRTIYLLLIAIKSLALKKWSLGMGSLVHAILVGGTLYVLSCVLMLSLGVGAVGGH